MKLIGLTLFISGCVNSFPKEKSDSFPDNPTSDFDRDGLTEQLGDCDDLDPAVDSPLTFYRDADDDGYGDQTETKQSCEQPEGYVTIADDCNDNDPNTYPGSSNEGPLLCVRDEDLDGYGDINANAPYNPGTDCNDNSPEIFLGSARNESWLCAKDSDGDGYGDAAPAIEAENGSDCNDEDARVYPGNNFEAGILCIFDQDNDGFGDTNPPLPYSQGTDCDDSEPQSNPWGLEICDEQDNNCNDEIDENGAYGAPIWYVDIDLDGFGNDNVVSISQCGNVAPEGYSAIGLDCDDSNNNVFPGNQEQCDEIDNNCNQQVDEGVLQTFYSDLDGDSYGSPVNSVLGCYAPSGFTDNTDDCDDGDNMQHPGANEYCNGEDDNCDGTTDESTAIDVQTWYYDEDGDSYGNDGAILVQCFQETNYVAQNGDCDDGDPFQNPNAIEQCNNEDDDCNGLIDDDPEGQLVFYLDFDEDGDGSSEDLDLDGIPDNQITACPVYNPLPQAPLGYSSTSGDCDDNDSDRSSLLPEQCSPLIDENCDGNPTIGSTDVTTWYADSDQDGYGNGEYTIATCPSALTPSGAPQGYTDNAEDCNDNDGEMYPNAIEICNGKLQDCNLAEDDSFGPLSEERDDDGDGFIECDFTPFNWAVVSTIPYGWGDCQDDDIDVYPGAPERCSGEVEDCDSLDYGTTPDDEFDDDGDGFVECSGWFIGTWEGQSTVIGGDDCNDDNEFTFPGAAELVPDSELCAQDADDDGYPDCVRWFGNSAQLGPTSYTCDYGLFLSSNPDIGPDFVEVPAGDDPLGRYTLTRSFYMMTTEVTQSMFELLIGYNPSYFQGSSILDESDYPVDYANWLEAAEFANLLSELDGLAPCYDPSAAYTPYGQYSGNNYYDCPGYRLPTQAEWVYAAHSGSAEEIWTENGGGPPIDLNHLSYVDDGTDVLLSSLSWFRDSAGFRTQRVAQLSPNGFGLYDMYGNMREWTNDWFISYSAFPSSYIDPIGLNGTNKMIAGSAWMDYPDNVSSEQIGTFNPTSSYSDIGFRLVRTKF